MCGQGPSSGSIVERCAAMCSAYAIPGTRSHSSGIITTPHTGMCNSSYTFRNRGYYSCNTTVYGMWCQGPSSGSMVEARAEMNTPDRIPGSGSRSPETTTNLCAGMCKSSCTFRNSGYYSRNTTV